MPSQYGFKVLIYIGPDSWHSQSKPGPGSQVSHWPLHRLLEREMSAENSQGSRGCQALWKWLPIWPSLSWTHAQEGGNASNKAV